MEKIKCFFYGLFIRISLKGKNKVHWQRFVYCLSTFMKSNFSSFTTNSRKNLVYWIPTAEITNRCSVIPFSILLLNSHLFQVPFLSIVFQIIGENENWKIRISAIRQMNLEVTLTENKIWLICWYSRVKKGFRYWIQHLPGSRKHRGAPPWNVGFIPNPRRE